MYKQKQKNTAYRKLVNPKTGKFSTIQRIFSFSYVTATAVDLESGSVWVVSKLIVSLFIRISSFCYYTEGGEENCGRKVTKKIGFFSLMWYDR